MIVRVIIDECLSPRIALFLESKGYEVIYIHDGRPDSSIMALGYKLNAWILTANAKDFQNYPKVIKIRSRARPKDVYKRIKELI